MRRLAHCSDLHFGAHLPRVVDALAEDVRAQRPDLVVVSGDLTQRARRRQFRAAAAFLERLGRPRLVVPGNHDVPLWDVARRFLRPLHRFRRYIDRDPMPVYRDDELVAVGVNTARSLTWTRGRISHEQMELLRERLGPPDDALFKVVVTHHEFVPREGATLTSVLGRAARALEVLEECGVDLLLAGHRHVGYSSDVRAHYPARTRSMIVAQAGTATSWRLREHTNAYNLIEIDRDRFAIQVRSYDGGAFRPSDEQAFERAGAHGWRPR